jgi:hypothetical protein
MPESLPNKRATAVAAVAAWEELIVVGKER